METIIVLAIILLTHILVYQLGKYKISTKYLIDINKVRSKLYKLELDNQTVKHGATIRENSHREQVGILTTQLTESIAKNSLMRNEMTNANEEYRKDIYELSSQINELQQTITEKNEQIEAIYTEHNFAVDGLVSNLNEVITEKDKLIADGINKIEEAKREHLKCIKNQEVLEEQLEAKTKELFTLTKEYNQASDMIVYLKNQVED